MPVTSVGTILFHSKIRRKYDTYNKTSNEMLSGDSTNRTNETGRPGVETAANALRGAVNVCRAAGIDLTSPVTELTRKRIDAALAAFMQRGISRLSAWSYVSQL